MRRHHDMTLMENSHIQTQFMSRDYSLWKMVTMTNIFSWRTRLNMYKWIVFSLYRSISRFFGDVLKRNWHEWIFELEIGKIST